MSKFLLTGSHGFIGSHIRERLSDHFVIKCDSLEPQVHGSSGLGIRAGRRGLSDYDIVIHLAALVGVGQSMYQPARYVECNTLDTARFLENLSKSPPRKLIVASSMSIYGEGGYSVETQAPDIRSVYALTKYDQEQLCLMWGKMHNVPTIALRFFNCFGPGQALTNPYTGALAIFATRLLNGKQPVIYEDGQQSRDFIYVTDIADAVVHAALTDIPAGIYNVGSGASRTIESVAFDLAEVMGRDIKPLITHQQRQGDIRHCSANIEKILTTGWMPRVPFYAGLLKYADWLKTQPIPEDKFDLAAAELEKNGLTSSIPSH